ncbi:MAG: phytanoyl-CoA dioxygenase family protein [Planctomycetota bacterium]|nr:phytanoyl-CoA dioxygenase family protein [Planctomycetota bacterium]
MELTEQQKAFFDTFGYLVFPGLMKDSVGWITEEFELVFKNNADVKHDGSRRTMYPGSFIDQREKLSTLLDDARVTGICRGLLGDDFQYQGGDGNYYSGDTGWHSDVMPLVGMYRAMRHIKIAFYLDPLTRDTGALRVIPGSHLPGDRFSDKLCKNIHTVCGGRDVPSVALETQPGDLAVFHHNLKHASFGGSKFRRMFTMNLCELPHTDEGKRELHTLLVGWYGGHDGAERLHAPAMLDSATPERLRHLTPIKAYEAEMTRAAREMRAAKAKAEPAPAR